MDTGGPQGFRNETSGTKPELLATDLSIDCCVNRWVARSSPDRGAFGFVAKLRYRPVNTEPREAGPPTFVRFLQ